MAAAVSAAAKPTGRYVRRLCAGRSWMAPQTFAFGVSSVLAARSFVRDAASPPCRGKVWSRLESGMHVF